MTESPGLLRRLDASGAPLLIARLVVGGLFIKMGWVKAADPVEFLKLIREYRMVDEGSPWLMNSLAAVLPWAEIAGGVLLIAGVALRGTALLFLLMLIGFTGAILIRALGIFHEGTSAFCGIRFDCGCGSGEVLICNKLLENVGLTLLSLLIVFSRSRRFCLRGDLFARQGPTMAAS